MANQFKKAFKGIDRAIKQGTQRALNRALKTTKTSVVRTLREETGLKTDLITERIRAKSAKGDSNNVILALAVKFDVPVGRFQPKAKKVMSSSGKRRVGATAKIGKGSRELVPGSFLIPGTTAVVKRVGSERTPTKHPKSDVFRKAAQAAQRPAEAKLKETFEKNVSHEIDFAVQRALNKNGK